MVREIDILLATRNGDQFLSAQLQSILDQDWRDFRVLVRDDGSSDKTFDILTDFSTRFGSRMNILSDRTPTGSAKANFSRLLEASNADYTLFSDQDDVWLPHRISETIRLLDEATERYGTEEPIYAFTDVKAVRRDLSVLDDSYFRFKKIDPRIVEHLSQCIVCPPMLGCASGINRALRDLCLPIPTDQVTGHDWWALLLAVSAGRAVYSSNATLLYRQHGGNASGQMQTSLSSYAGRTGKTAKVRRGMHLRSKQALAVANRLQDRGLAPDSIQILQRFSTIGTLGWIARRKELVTGRYLYPDALRNTAMLCLC